MGGRLGHAIFYEPHKIAADPLYLFKVWDGLSSLADSSSRHSYAGYFSEKKTRVKANPQRKEEGKPLLLLYAPVIMVIVSSTDSR